MAIRTPLQKILQKILAFSLRRAHHLRMRWKNILIGCSAACLGIVPALAAVSQEPSANTKTATVMIAIFDKNGDFTGWGTGFYVDERILVTNKHIINGGQYYRVYATGEDDVVNLECFRNLTRSDVKLNLDDDVAYIRASLPCDHGTLYFAKEDPQAGDSVGVVGFPNRGSLKESMRQSQTKGTVTGPDEGTPWIQTTAFVDFGNSGGPVVKDNTVVGVVVAKATDSNLNFVYGLFIPASQIVRGLEYANSATFGYTPQSEQSNPAYAQPERTGPMTDADCSLLLGEGGRAADNGDCKCIVGFQRSANGLMCVRTGSASSVSSSSSSSSKSSASVGLAPRSSESEVGYSSQRSATPMTGLQMRTCERVKRQFFGESLRRVNERLQKRLGFGC